MLYTLDELFALLDKTGDPALPPQSARTLLPDDAGQKTLFDDAAPASGSGGTFRRPPPGPGLYLSGNLDLAGLPESARRLFDLSVDAYSAFVHVWMSELSIEAAAIRFGRKVLAATDRQGAERAATDRGDPDVQIVQETAYKVQREIHRLLGFLRFSSGLEGLYTARCAPDYLVLPALASHFVRRFGDTPWAIIDEKRNLCLRRLPDGTAGGEPELVIAGFPLTDPLGLTDPWDLGDPWEKLWRQYHRVINNESRKNPGLQRQFMPLRYWKYLPEVAGKDRGFP
ncbi:hypothetical protein AGMMS49928_06570 [Spirochaetia bacterium]|nr:hypothetical protein AGMMS49928_06570 [Spirochaetia bacterium]